MWWLVTAALAADWFAVEVKDTDGAPVGCATLRTTFGTIHRTDASGRFAFFEPGLVGAEVFFEVIEAPGYTVTPDWIGFSGARVVVTDGGSATLPVTVTRGDPPPCDDDLASRLLAAPRPEAGDYFEVRFVDAATGRGVPLVHLDNALGTWVSDSAGRVALWHPDLAGQTTAFTVHTHGYAPAQPALVLTVTPGGSLEVPLDRTILAERLYRLTGLGIYRDSVLLGREVPLAEPVSNGMIAGQDGGRVGLWDGRAVLLFGDTIWPTYPLGSFRGNAAFADPPAASGLPADDGVDLAYVEDDLGRGRAVLPFDVEGLVWPGDPVSVPDGAGGAALVVDWLNVRSGFEIGAQGMARWDDDDEVFVPFLTFAPDEPARPSGAVLTWPHDDGDWLYWYDGTRAPADLAALSEASSYEAFTLYGPDGEVVLDGDRPVWAWRHDARAVTEGDVTDLFGGGLPEDSLLRGNARDPDGGDPVADHIGATQWSPYRRRFVKVFAESFGTSFLGETWVAEADTPMGPWTYARKVVSHDDKDFYNPEWFAFLDDPDGRRVHFAATYSGTFGGGAPSPRYDYNLVVYALDLDDDAMVLPVPVYEVEGGYAVRDRLHHGVGALEPAFLAPDRPVEGLVPVGYTGPDCAPRSLAVGEFDGETLFWALPLGTVPVSRDTTVIEGRALVWENPVRVPMPVGDYLGPLVADAGPDQCAKGGSVTLDCGATFARDGGLDCAWSWAGGQDVGDVVDLDLGRGVHVITLTATDALGRTDDDVVVVEIGRRCGCAAGGSAPVAPFGLLALALSRRRPTRSRGGAHWTTSPDRARIRAETREEVR